MRWEMQNTERERVPCEMHKKLDIGKAWRNRSFLRNVISPLRVAVVIDKIHRHGMTVERKLLRSIISSSEKEWPTPEYSRKSWAEFIVFNRSPVIFAHSIRISGSLVPWHWRIGVDLLDLHRPGRKEMSIWGGNVRLNRRKRIAGAKVV